MSAKTLEADRIVKRWMWWSMGAGLIPVPTVDVAAVVGLQIKMLSDLSKLYGVEFSENRGKSIVTALLGGIVPNALVLGPAGILIKGLPVIGAIAGAISMPVFFGAGTYAVGRVFTEHFESGGTFLNFDPAAHKEKFAAEFERGRQEAKGTKNKAS